MTSTNGAFAWTYRYVCENGDWQRGVLRQFGTYMWFFRGAELPGVCVCASTPDYGRTLCVRSKDSDGRLLECWREQDADVRFSEGNAELLLELFDLLSACEARPETKEQS